MSGKPASSIVSSLGPLKLLKADRTPAHPEARTPAQPHARTPEQPDAQAFDQPGVHASVRTDTRTSGRAGVREPGKRGNPDFTKRTVLLRDTTWKKAALKWWNEGDGDFSNLVEKLLREYSDGD